VTVPGLRPILLLDFDQSREPTDRPAGQDRTPTAALIQPERNRREDVE
jgi:hypothetical protein